MQLLRRPRPLSERECVARLYDGRTGLVEVLWPRHPRPVAAPPPPGPPAPSGPTAEFPALHLAIRYPRARGRMTGEEVRADLERRLKARAA